MVIDKELIKSQEKIGKPHILFSKIEDSMVEEEVGRLNVNSFQIKN